MQYLRIVNPNGNLRHIRSIKLNYSPRARFNTCLKPLMWFVLFFFCVGAVVVSIPLHIQYDENSKQINYS